MMRRGSHRAIPRTRHPAHLSSSVALAAAALLFGKALAPQEVPALALVIGGIAFVGLYAFGIILVYLGEGE
jgi:hypothetical protein